MKMKTITLITSTIGLIAALAPPCYGQHFSALYTLSGDNPGGLSQGMGMLYDTTFAYGGSGFNCGSVYELKAPTPKGGPWVETVLYSFPNVLGGPCSPAGAPVVGTGGGIYGTTSAGGPYFLGVFYGLRPPSSPGGPWTETVLYDFDTPGTGVGYAASGLVGGPNGSFYLLTSDNDLCQLQPPTSPGGAWTATLLYSFPASAAAPLTSLVAGPNGLLYGTAASGGTGRLGEVFQLAPPAAPGALWSMTALHSFNSPGGGVGNPNSLTVAPGGTIYGATYGFDRDGYGGTAAVFQLTPPSSPGGEWTYAALTTPGNTEHFITPLILAAGNLYGAYVTGPDGASGGSVFELQPPSAPGDAWTMTTLHTFTDGQIPSGNLVDGGDGTIYGTAAAAPGQPSGGTVYAITTK
jgi:hypothetical protein